jgi:RIO kinase 2
MCECVCVRVCVLIVCACVRMCLCGAWFLVQALHERGFPTPVPIDCNRHCVLMSLVVGFPLHQVARLRNPRGVYDQMIDIVVRLAQCGLIHCDFNEFNAMVNDEEVVTMIDFPQMVSTSHPNAEMYVCACMCVCVRASQAL